MTSETMRFFNYFSFNYFIMIFIVI